MKKIIASILLSLTFAIITLVGCGKAIVQHPGAVNSFDNAAYDTLRIEEAAILQAKSALATTPKIQPAYDLAKTQYNLTIVAYKTYHLAAVAGNNPDTTALQASIADLVGKVAAMLKATGVVN